MNVVKSHQRKSAIRAQMSGWFTASREGDSTAISQLLEAFRPVLLNFTAKHFDSEIRQKVAASDVVQVSLIKATLAYHKADFDTLRDLTAWLKEILKNEMRAVHRRYRLAKKRDARREENVDSPQLRKWLDLLAIRAATDCSQGISRMEEFTLLRAAFDELKRHYRKIIEWHSIEGLTFDAIATKLDRTPDAARMLHHRALKKLRAEYQKRR